MTVSEFIYPVELLHLFVSPRHDYFGRSDVSGIGEHLVNDCDQIELVSGEGIVGDRFFGKGPDFDGHVTFFASESLEGDRYDLLRRNLVTRGLPVTALIGHEFEIFAEGDRANAIRFLGTKHCAPCRWLDHALGEGTMARLRGRGGLRAQVLGDGILTRGDRYHVASPIELMPERAGEPLARPSLP